MQGFQLLQQQTSTSMKQQMDPYEASNFIFSVCWAVTNMQGFQLLQQQMSTSVKQQMDPDEASNFIHGPKEAGKYQRCMRSKVCSLHTASAPNGGKMAPAKMR
jgi:hypothetical protein